MNAQLELLPQTSADKQVAWLETFLKDRPAWHTAEMIQKALNGVPTEAGKRLIRQLANQSQWIISGQKGYKHTSHATQEEITHFVHWMESQAREMTRRAESIRRNAHRILG